MAGCVVGIVSFRFDRELLSEFVQLPYRLYRNDSRWIPPIKSLALAELTPSADHFRGPRNDHRHFVARCATRTVGRVTASISEALVDSAGTPIGCVGYFEAEADPALAADLLDAAVGWLREQHGVRHVWGPIQLNAWQGYRLMTRGFDRWHFPGEPYNPPHYPESFERWGFCPLRRWHSFEVGSPDDSCEFEARGLARESSLRDLGYRFTDLNRRQLDAELDKLHRLISACYAHFPALTPISRAAFLRLANPLRHALLRGSASFVADESGEPCGFAVAMLNLGEALRAMAGSHSPLARWRFLRTRRQQRHTILHMAGLLPAEARRHRGLGAALCARIFRALRAQRLTPQLLALIAEDSPARHHVQALHAHATREYVLYGVSA